VLLKWPRKSSPTCARCLGTSGVAYTLSTRELLIWLPSARFTLHSTKLCTKLRIFRKNSL
jgi:hypothetical protein